MATVSYFAPSGLTLTLKLFPLGSDVEAFSGTSTEQTNRKGLYQNIVTGKSGRHTGHIFLVTDAIAAGHLTLSDDSAEYWIEPSQAVTFPATAASINPAITSLGNIEIYRGDTVAISITDMGNISARSNIGFAVKATKEDSDANAILHLDVDTGLITVEGSTSGFNATDASIVVDDQVNGDITITLKDEATELLKGTLDAVYDVQVQFSDGSVKTLAAGSAWVILDVVQTTT